MLARSPLHRTRPLTRLGVRAHSFRSTPNQWRFRANPKPLLALGLTSAVLLGLTFTKKTRVDSEVATAKPVGCLHLLPELRRILDANTSFPPPESSSTNIHDTLSYLSAFLRAFYGEGNTEFIELEIFNLTNHAPRFYDDLEPLWTSSYLRIRDACQRLQGGMTDDEEVFEVYKVFWEEQSRILHLSPAIVWAAQWRARGQEQQAPPPKDPYYILLQEDVPQLESQTEGPREAIDCIINVGSILLAEYRSPQLCDMLLWGCTIDSQGTGLSVAKDVQGTFARMKDIWRRRANPSTDMNELIQGLRMEFEGLYLEMWRRQKLSLDEELFEFLEDGNASARLEWASDSALAPDVYYRTLF